MIGENQQKLVLKLPDKDKEEDYSSDEEWEDNNLQAVPKKIKPKKTISNNNKFNNNNNFNDNYNDNNNDWFGDQLNQINQRWNYQFPQRMQNFIPNSGKSYTTTLRCYPPHFVDAQKIAEGDKVLLPGSVLNALTMANTRSPWLFEITNPKNKKKIYASVLEFIAPDGMIFMPDWMIHFIDAKAADNVTIKNVQLPMGKYAKLKPVNYEEFNKLTNARDLLESKLRSFATLMKGATISVNHSGTDFIFVVVDLKPEDAVCIINSDLNTEFDLPEGYKVPNETKESIKNKTNQKEDDSDDDSDKSSEEDSSFKGVGYTTSSSNLTNEVNNQVETVTCSNCERKVPKASIFSHEAFCFRNVERCKDCGKPITKGKREEHYKEFHSPVKCDKCGQFLVKDMLETHQLFECSNRSIDCEFCNLSFPFKEFEEHQSHCGSRTEKCDSCQRRVKLRDLRKHKESNCSYFPKNETSRFVSQDLVICHECQHPFTDVSQLEMHILKEHTKPIPKKVTTSTPKKVTHDDDLFFCHFCYDPFQQIESLQNHINQVHKEQMDLSDN